MFYVKKMKTQVGLALLAIVATNENIQRTASVLNLLEKKLKKQKMRSVIIKIVKSQFNQENFIFN